MAVSAFYSESHGINTNMYSQSNGHKASPPFKQEMQPTAYPYYGNALAPCGVTVILTGNTEFVNFPWEINRKTPGILSLRVFFHK